MLSALDATSAPRLDRRLLPVLDRLPAVDPGTLAALAVLLVGGAAGAALAFDPVTVPLAVGGSVLLTVCVLRLDVALFLLLAAGPLESAMPEGAPSISKLAGGLTFVAFAVWLVRGRHRLRLTALHGIVAAFLAVALASSALARDQSLALSTTVRYVSFGLLLLVVSQVAADERLLRRMILVLTLAGTVAAALALKHFLLDGERVAIPNSGEPNDLAYILATTIPLTLWLAMSSTRRLRATLLFGCSAVMAASAVLSFSRSAVLGLAAGVVFYVVVERKHLGSLIVALAVGALAILGFALANPHAVSSAITQKQDIGQHNIDTRYVAWNAALGLAASHPVLGIGPGNFVLYFFEATGNPPTTEHLAVTHDGYVDTATETGFLGLALFLAYLVTIGGRLVALRRSPEAPRDLPGLLAAAFVVACVGLLTHSQQYLPPIWLLGGITAALHRRGRRPGERQPVGA